MDTAIDMVDCANAAKISKKQQHHYEKNIHGHNGAVHVFTGNEKQRPVRNTTVVYDRNVDRVRPHLDNEWANYENTPNRQAQEQYNRNRRSIESAGGEGSRSRKNGGELSPETYRNVVENALNVAFLAANSNQLRLLTENQQEEPTYQACVGMVIMSLILQILVGVSMVTISVNNDQRWQKLKTVASVVVAIIALINIVVLSLLNAVVLG